MLSGAFFYEFFHRLAFLAPYLIFSMLFITYCKLSFRDLRFSRLHVSLLAVQIVGSLAVYTALRWFDPVVAQGCMICVLAPTATAAAVVTGMLGGKRSLFGSLYLVEQSGDCIGVPVAFHLDWGK